MEKWLKPALEYVSLWLDYQMEQSETPGCVLAITHRGRVVLEKPFGVRRPSLCDSTHVAAPLPRGVA